MSAGNASGQYQVAPEAAEQLAIVTADVTGTGALLEKAGDLSVHTAFKELLQRADNLRAAHCGRIIKSFGDGFMAVFPETAAALTFAASFQRSMALSPIRVAGEPLTVRVSLHVAPVHLVQTSYGEDVFGEDVNLAARLTRLAEPGEVLVSGAARQALTDEQRSLLGPPELRAVRGAVNGVEISRLHPV